MKRIKLTEGDLVNIIKKVIKESSHEFQNYEDSILDKISSEGFESLSNIEKTILNNVSSENFNTKPIMLMIAKKIASREQLTDIEKMFYDEYSVSPVETKGRELEPNVIYDAGDDEIPASDDRENKFTFEDPKGQIPSMSFELSKIYFTDKYLIFQGTLEVGDTQYYGKIFTDPNGEYLGNKFKSENQTSPNDDYESTPIDAFLTVAAQQLNQDDQQNNEY